MKIARQLLWHASPRLRMAGAGSAFSDGRSTADSALFRRGSSKFRRDEAQKRSDEKLLPMIAQTVHGVHARSPRHAVRLLAWHHAKMARLVFFPEHKNMSIAARAQEQQAWQELWQAVTPWQRRQMLVNAILSNVGSQPAEAGSAKLAVEDGAVHIEQINEAVRSIKPWGWDTGQWILKRDHVPSTRPALRGMDESANDILQEVRNIAALLERRTGVGRSSGRGSE